MKWSYAIILGLLCLLACVASATADNCCALQRFQDSSPYAIPYFGYGAAFWHYAVPLLKPSVQVGGKLYYSLNTGKYYSFASNSPRFPTGLWWM